MSSSEPIGPVRAVSVHPEDLGQRSSLFAMEDAAGVPPGHVAMFLARIEAVNKLMREKGLSRIQSRQYVAAQTDEIIQAKMAAVPELAAAFAALPKVGTLADWWAAHKDTILAIGKLIFEIVLAILPLLAGKSPEEVVALLAGISRSEQLGFVGGVGPIVGNLSAINRVDFKP